MRERSEIREKILKIAERFRKKGATSPDRAMSLVDLCLPPRFKYLMQSPMGNLGIFMEIDGKYYLSEEHLKPIEEPKHVRWTARDSRQKLLTLRIIRITIGLLFTTLLLVNLFVRSLEIRLVSSVFLVFLIGTSILQLYYLTKAKSRTSRL